jgi:PRA1 family protein 1
LDDERQRYHSDELHFDGIDLGRGLPRRQRSGPSYNDDFTPSDDDEDYDAQRLLVRRSDMQLAFREKEDVLVQRALERISRARALGRENVKLSRAEMDALDRRQKERSQPPPRPVVAPKTAAPKSKKDMQVVKRKPVESRKAVTRSTGRSASDSPTKGKVESRGRGKSGTASARQSRDNSITDYDLSRDLDYDRRLPYPRDSRLQGFRQAESSRRGSRSNSNQSLRQPSQAMPPYQHPYHANRYSSNPDVLYSNRPASNSSRTSRPDPAEMDWEPRARSTSSLVNVPLDQIPYQAHVGRALRFDPSDPRFGSPQRRVASGPPVVQQPDPARYRRPQDELFLPEDPPEVYNYLAPSEQDEDVEDDEEDTGTTEDSDYEAGVEVVDVSERAGGNYAIQTRSAAAASSSRAQVTGRNTSKSVARKKGR